MYSTDISVATLTFFFFFFLFVWGCIIIIIIIIIIIKITLCNKYYPISYGSNAALTIIYICRALNYRLIVDKNKSCKMKTAKIY